MSKEITTLLDHLKSATKDRALKVRQNRNHAIARIDGIVRDLENSLNGTKWLKETASIQTFVDLPGMGEHVRLVADAQRTLDDLGNLGQLLEQLAEAPEEIAAHVVRQLDEHLSNLPELARQVQEAGRVAMATVIDHAAAADVKALKARLDDLFDGQYTPEEAHQVVSALTHNLKPAVTVLTPGGSK